MRPNMDGAFASGDPPATEVGITFSDVDGERGRDEVGGSGFAMVESGEGM